MGLLDDGHRARFERWLSERGAEVLEPTNPWEVVRFRANSQVSVIYRNKRGISSMTGEAEDAWDAYRSGDHSWRGTERTDRRQLTPLHRTLRERDGDDCFYCGEHLDPGGDVSVEHLVSLTHGGPNHVANLVLCCEDCNREAGHLSVAEKVRLRERKQGMNEQG